MKLKLRKYKSKNFNLAGVKSQLLDENLASLKCPPFLSIGTHPINQ